jgi:hypothetical protein
MIKPTIGRVVWYHPHSFQASADFAPTPICAAIVAFVHSDHCVNLAVFDANGNSHSRTSVTLIQDGAEPSEGGNYCEWMPYQKGQAAKAESLEAKLGEKS